MGVLMKTLDKVFPAQQGIPEITGVDMHEEVDVRGFDMGIALDRQRQQGTINLGLDTGGHIGEAEWCRWEDSIATTEQMVCTATVDEAGEYAARPRIATTFRAVDRQERKDMTNLVTTVSMRQSTLYDQAEAQGLSARPMDASAMSEAVARGLCGRSMPFEELKNTELSDRGHYLRIENHRWARVYVANTAMPQVSDLLDDVMNSWEGEDTIRRTRLFRPYVLPEGTGEDMATGAGRRWAVVTIIGGTDADAGFREVINLDPLLGLHIRPMFGRQRTGVLAGLGTGVLGWQHIGSAQRREMD